MRFSLIVLALIAPACALASKLLNERAAAATTICDRIGKKCASSEAPLCCDPAGPLGFAHCVKGKVKLTACRDGCGSEAGVVQCIANPDNNLLM